MFGFNKETAPKLLPSNPEKGVEGTVGFSNAGRNWTEQYSLIPLIASVLGDQGHQVQREESWLIHKDSGFILLPQFVYLKPLNDGGVQTTTTIQVHHPSLVPEGTFEYQHSTGDNVEDSIRKGFDQWVQADLVTLLDALLPAPQNCTTLKMEFPAKDGKPAYSRRAVLGSVTHFVQNPQVYEERAQSIGQNQQSESHEFCPCCLLTNSFNTFKELIEDHTFFGLRLFAARDEKGIPQADCRVNGQDWEKGKESLQKYVETWPDVGYEFRKQYVVLQNDEKKS